MNLSGERRRRIMDERLIMLSEKIRDLRGISEEILRIGGDIPALTKNMKKILANIKMLELNFSDLVELERKE
jgi:hypothetical protein